MGVLGGGEMRICLSHYVRAQIPSGALRSSHNVALTVKERKREWVRKSESRSGGLACLGLNKKKEGRITKSRSVGSRPKNGCLAAVLVWCILASLLVLSPSVS